MAAVDPYTSRLETSMRLLTERLAWLDGQSRQLAAENDSLRRELDLAGQRLDEEQQARPGQITTVAELRVAAEDAARLEEFEQRRRALASRLSELEGRARARIEEIRASSERLDDAVLEELRELEAEEDSPGDLNEAGPEPEVLAATELDLGEESRALEEAVDHPDLEEIAARRAEAEALDLEIKALLRLRGTIVTSVREMLIGLAEELSYAENEHLATLPPPEGEPELPA